MRTPEEIVLEQAQTLVKKGANWFNSLEEFKSFVVDCCKISQEEAYKQGQIDIRKKLEE